MSLKACQLTMWKSHMIHGLVIWKKPVSVHMFDHLNKSNSLFFTWSLISVAAGSEGVAFSWHCSFLLSTWGNLLPRSSWKDTCRMSWLLQREKWLQRLASSIHVKLTWDPLENLIWNRISSSFRAQRLASYSRACVLTQLLIIYEFSSFVLLWLCRLDAPCSRICFQRSRFPQSWCKSTCCSVWIRMFACFQVIGLDMKFKSEGTIAIVWPWRVGELIGS